MQRDDRSLWQRKFSNKNGGITLENLPDSNKILQFNEVEELAINLPSIIMTQESGNDEWYNRLFGGQFLLSHKIYQTLFMRQKSSENKLKFN